MGFGTRFKQLRIALLAVALAGSFAAAPSFAAAQVECGPILRNLLDNARAPKRRIDAIAELNIGTYNIYNFFRSAAPGGGDKPRALMDAMADMIRRNNLDVVVLEEMNSVEDLARFNQEFLGGAYRTLVADGNEAGMKVTFLVKKDLPFRVELTSHASTTDVYPVTGQRIRVFTRDAPALHLFRGDAREGDSPIMTLIGVHNKSMRDRRGDRDSTVLRTLQASATADIVAHYQRQWPDAPVLVAGDFNSFIHDGDVVRPLTNILEDSLGMGARPVPVAERITYSYVEVVPPVYNQLDAILVPPSLRDDVVESYIDRYRDANGNVRPLATTLPELDSTLPSDHFPVILKLRFQNLLRRMRSAPQGELPQANAA
jgi:endonuclease/exonuclease/phosphatase family metal-dependent hydrolase